MLNRPEQFYDRQTLFESMDQRCFSPIRFASTPDWAWRLSARPRYQSIRADFSPRISPATRRGSASIWLPAEETGGHGPSDLVDQYRHRTAETPLCQLCLSDVNVAEKMKRLVLRTPIRAHVAEHRLLKPLGWGRSFRDGQSVNALGQPIPWMCYPVVEFLEERVPQGVAVFEWGSGNSTLWWAQRASRVIACEHDVHWAAYVKSRSPSNAEVITRELVGEDYPLESSRHDRFDIVVIDGRRRVECSQVALLCLTDRGVIVWDNSDRPEYSDGLGGLRDAGFRTLTFSGLAPLVSRPTSTTIAYRDNNVLKL